MVIFFFTLMDNGFLISVIGRIALKELKRLRKSLLRALVKDWAYAVQKLCLPDY